MYQDSPAMQVLAALKLEQQSQVRDLPMLGTCP